MGSSSLALLQVERGEGRPGRAVAEDVVDCQGNEGQDQEHDERSLQSRAALGMDNDQSH